MGCDGGGAVAVMAEAEFVDEDALFEALLEAPVEALLEAELEAELVGAPGVSTVNT